MNLYFFISGVLAFLAGLGHSYIGEKHFLPRLRQCEDPDHFGVEGYVNRALRATWHFVTFALWSAAAILIIFSFRQFEPSMIIVFRIISNFYFFTGVYLLVLSRGRQVLWIVLFVISALIWIGTI